MATASVGYLGAEYAVNNVSGVPWASPYQTHTNKSQLPRLLNISGGWDWDVQSGSKAVSEIIYSPAGPAVPGATVWLVRETDKQVVATCTTDGSGTYTFIRDANDPFTYWVLAYDATTPTNHGTPYT